MIYNHHGWLGIKPQLSSCLLKNRPQQSPLIKFKILTDDCCFYSTTVQILSLINYNWKTPVISEETVLSLINYNWKMPVISEETVKRVGLLKDKAQLPTEMYNTKSSYAQTARIKIKVHIWPKNTTTTPFH